MSEPRQDLKEGPEQGGPSPENDVTQQKQKQLEAEAQEVAGRHQNDGRNGHVGHKVSR